MRKIKIIQVLPTISYGDAVSNDAINIDKIFKKNGYETELYAENIDKKLKDKVFKISKLKKVNKNDILIYHKSTGTDLSFLLEKYKCKKIMRYHNITPGKYLEKYNKYLYNLVEYGRKGLEYASKYFNYSLAVSDYNKNELDKLKYKSTMTLPILIPFEDYKKEPDKKVIKKYSDGKKNILFVGRVVPNKAQEDIIKSFYYYKKYANGDSRLILVGNDNGFKNYSDLLKRLVTELGLENDVIFSGHIIGLFRDDADVIKVGTFALRAQCVVLFLSPITLAASMMFQGAGENLASSIASFLRSGITFVPMVLILPKFLGIYGIQLAQPVADIISFIIVMPLIVNFFRKINA